MRTTTKRRRIVVDDSALAQSIGSRIRERRRRAGLSQQRLAEGRYTKAYISALETGAAKPSMAALNFIAGRLGTTAAELLANPDTAWTRLEADLKLASGDVLAAVDAYRSLLETQPDTSARAELLRSLAEASCRIDRPIDAIRAASESVELFQSSTGRSIEPSRSTGWRRPSSSRTIRTRPGTSSPGCLPRFGPD